MNFPPVLLVLVLVLVLVLGSGRAEEGVVACWSDGVLGAGWDWGLACLIREPEGGGVLPGAVEEPTNCWG